MPPLKDLQRYHFHACLRAATAVAIGRPLDGVLPLWICHQADGSTNSFFRYVLLSDHPGPQLSTGNWAPAVPPQGLQDQLGPMRVRFTCVPAAGSPEIGELNGSAVALPPALAQAVRQVAPQLAPGNAVPAGHG